MFDKRLMATAVIKCGDDLRDLECHGKDLRGNAGGQRHGYRPDHPCLHADPPLFPDKENHGNELSCLKNRKAGHAGADLQEDPAAGKYLSRTCHHRTAGAGILLAGSLPCKAPFL